MSLDPHGLAQRLLALQAQALAPRPLALHQLVHPLPGIVGQAEVMLRYAPRGKAQSRLCYDILER